MNNYPPLVDTLGRIHHDLRISVTDRCNIRCFYCMPNEDVIFKPRSEILTYDEIYRFVRVLAGMGIHKVRITGGEPLVRKDLCKLIKQLAAIPGIRDLAMTTNGILLAEHAQDLKDAGLKRVNISLDTLREETFQRIARRAGLKQVFEGIRAAKEVGFEKVRLNAVAIQGITNDDIVPLANFSRDQGLELRFIEFMPLDAEKNWNSDQVLSGEKILSILEEAICPLKPVKRSNRSQPAMDYQFVDSIGRIGFINPVSQPFCSSCNRLRITAEGQIRNCLFSIEEWDARRLLRSGGSDEDLMRLVRESVAAKKPGHGIDGDQFVRPERAMYQIGG